jgi:hypothetical protein
LDTAFSFTAVPLAYAQYFLDKAQLSVVLLPTAQPGSLHPHAVPPYAQYFLDKAQLSMPA